jgi:D-alanyl-D-alanine endopeptidase (penicillin-binding protein 7)
MWKSLLISALVALAPVLATAADADSVHTVSYKKKHTRHASSRLHRAALRVSAEHLYLRSNSVLVFDQSTGEPVYAKNVDAVQPIASITKLMTALVVMESNLDLSEPVTVEAGDVDTLRNTRSRLSVGTVVRRGDLMRLALMASENRAAAALARSSPGGTAAFVELMNERAVALGLAQTHFSDATGLSSQNVSSPADLAKLVQAAYEYPLIREYSTTPGLMLTLPNSGRSVNFNNTNMLVKNSAWHIGLSKTGFINESGHCLVMQASIGARPFVIVLLDALGKYSRIADAIRVKRWLELRFASDSPGGSI